MTHLCAYYDNLYPDAFRDHIREMRHHGFSGVVFCVTEADLAWRMDAVADCFAVAHDERMTVWANPWGVGGIFSGETYASLPRFGGTPEQAAPIVEQWVSAVCQAGADMIVWDEPRSPDGLADWCDAAAYRGVQSAVTVTTDRLEMLDELARIPHVVELQLAGYYWPPYRGTPENRAADWCSQLLTATRPRGLDARLWLQGFRLPAGHEDIPLRSARLARQAGIDRFAFWSFRSCATMQMRAARHRELWDALPGALAA